MRLNNCVGKLLRLVPRQIKHIKRETLRRFAPNARQSLKLFDQLYKRYYMIRHHTLHHTGNLKASGDLLHLGVCCLLDCADRLIDSRDNQILKHFDVLRIDDFGLEDDRLDLLFAADRHLDHAAAGRRLKRELLKLLLLCLEVFSSCIFCAWRIIAFIFCGPPPIPCGNLAFI